jgi:transposase InsO family protein
LAYTAAVDATAQRPGIAGAEAQAASPTNRRTAASDLVARQFARDAPNQLWLIDILEHPTREGKLYCCAVLDAHSRPRGRLVDRQSSSDPAGHMPRKH